MGYHQILSLLVVPEWVQTNILTMWFDDFVKYVNPTPEEQAPGQLSWYSNGLDGLGSISSSARFFYSPWRPDGLWDPPSLLSNGYQALSPWG
jgi:hypothetical protein